MQIQDNKLSTTWTGAALLIYTDETGDGSGAAQQFDTVYAVCKGATSLTVQGFGSPVPIAEEIADNYDNMLSVVDADGYHHILHTNPTKVSAKVANLTFNASAEVAELWLLNENTALNISNDARFTQLDFTEIDRGASVKNSAVNVPHFIPGLGGQDLKTDVDCVCRFRPKHTSYLQLKKFFRENRRGFVCAVDYPAEATVVGQYIVDPTRTLRYLSTHKYSGKDYGFSLIQR